jgi:hypothetical protein
MDHYTIDTGNVAERYVTGRLTPEEAASFEEHYLDCHECCARVEAAERLQQGCRRLAELAAAGSPPAWGAVTAGRWPRLALAAAALVAVALLPAGLALRELRHLRGELAQTRGELARKAVASADPGRLAAVEGELRAARHDLAMEAQRRADHARDAGARLQPLINLPLVAFTQLRGGGSESGPSRTLTLPAAPGWIGLWVEPGDAEYPAFAARLLDARGSAVFQARGVVANELGALLVAVHSTALVPGSYRLEIDGLPPRRAPVPVARFPLQVVAHR